MKTKKISILVFTRDYPIGMAETKRIQHLLYYLFSQKIEINVISFRSKLPQPAEKGLDNCIPFVNIGIGLDFKLLKLHKIIVYIIKGLYLILKYKKEDCKNIVYCFGDINIENFLFVFWAKLLRYKLVFDINEDYSFFEDQVKAISRFKFWTVKQLDFITYCWSTAIIVISTHLMNKYLKRNNKHIVLIPVTAKQNFNANKKKINDPLQVVYAVSFNLKGGVNDIIEGFNSFNSIYQNARLILTGKSDQQVIYQEKYKKEDCKNIIYCYGAINIENILFLFWARLLRYKLVFDIVEDYSFFEDQVKAISRFKFWTVKQLDFITYRWSAAIIVISTHLMNKY